MLSKKSTYNSSTSEVSAYSKGNVFERMYAQNLIYVDVKAL